MEMLALLFAIQMVKLSTLINGVLTLTTRISSQQGDITVFALITSFHALLPNL